MTSTQKPRLLSEAINESGNALVEVRKAASAAAVAFVQSHGMDMAAGDTVSRETVDAGRHYRDMVWREERALATYGAALQSFIDRADDELKPKPAPDVLPSLGLGSRYPIN